jgi:PHD/YefM family antitoxin component YafN of YafNO toxin-antitoxin module
MKLRQRIKPVSYLKAHTAQLINELSAQRGTVVITQNGEARAVV